MHQDNMFSQDRPPLLSYKAIFRAVVVLIVCQLELQLPVQSVSIITNVVSSNPIHGEGVLDTTLCDEVCQ